MASRITDSTLGGCRLSVTAITSNCSDTRAASGWANTVRITVDELSLEEEMTDHLGYSKHEVTGRQSGNSRTGTRTKTVIPQKSRPVDIEVPWDRSGTFESVIVAKHPFRLKGWMRSRCR